MNRRTLGLAAALVSFVAGCNAFDPSRHGPVDGPLRLPGDAEIGVGQTAPEPGMTDITFGSLELCVADGVEDVTLVAIGPGEQLTSTGHVSVVIRRVDAAFTDDRSNPVGSAYGVPPDLVDTGLGGTLEPVEGAIIGLKCADRLANPRGPMIEVLVTLSDFGETGIGWKGIEVEYTVDGRQYVLEAPWSFYVCGSGIDEEDICVDA